MYDPADQEKRDKEARAEAARKRASASRKKKGKGKGKKVSPKGKRAEKQSCYLTLSACHKMLQMQREIQNLTDQYYDLMAGVERQLAYALQSRDPARWRRAEQAMAKMNEVFQKKQALDHKLEEDGGYREKCLNYLNKHEGVCAVTVNGTGPEGQKLGGKLPPRVRSAVKKRRRVSRSKGPARREDHVSDGEKLRREIRERRLAHLAAQKQHQQQLKGLMKHVHRIKNDLTPHQGRMSRLSSSLSGPFASSPLQSSSRSSSRSHSGRF